MHLKNKGFTLIELLVVIAIIGFLSTMATVAARYAINKAKISKAEHAVATISNAVIMLGNDTNEWPGHQTINSISTATGAEICGPDATLPTAVNCTYGLSDPLSGIEANSTPPFTSWQGPYMTNIVPDPWGHEYFFDTNYSINAGNEPCGCGSMGTTNCHDVVAVGSYGPDGLGVNKLNGTVSARPDGCDDILKIIIFN